MSPPPASGHHLPNLMAHAFFQGLEDLMGAHGVRATLRLAKLEAWVESPPGPTLEAKVDFAELAALLAALADLYGDRAAQTMTRRAARVVGERLVEALPALSTLMADEAFQTLDLHNRGTRLLETLAQALSEEGGRQDRVEPGPGRLVYIAEVCPDCWGRSGKDPLCAATAGWLEGTLSRLEGWEGGSVVEVACVAMGAPHCSFEVHLPGEP